MSHRLAALIVLCALLAAPAWAGKKSKPTDSITGEFGQISKAEMELTEVPFAPGAPAVVLFEGEKIFFDRPATGAPVTRTIYQRRVKILTEDGVEDTGDFKRLFHPRTENLKVKARTILPDGTIHDAKRDTFRDQGLSGHQTVGVAFPQVQVGAILEVITEDNNPYILHTEWTFQTRLPVMESVYIYSPPKELSVSQAFANLSEEEARARVVRTPRGQSLVWRFTDQPAIPIEPNQPAFMELPKTIYVIPVAWRGPGFNQDFGSDWSRWNRDKSEQWSNWLKIKSSSCKEFAREMTADLVDPLAKAEALREAVRDRVQRLSYSYLPQHPSADDGLAKGSGSSADVAGILVTALRSVGVSADLVAIRHREKGLMPEDFPLPYLFNDLLIRLNLDDGVIYFSPVAELPTWELPTFARGVIAMPIDRKTEAPIRLPDLSASENGAIREAAVEFGSDGVLQVASTHRFKGGRAESWRRRLRYHVEDKRRAIMQDALRRWAPGSHLQSMEILNLEDLAADLVIKCKFTLEGYVRSAGGRLLVNPNLFDRVPIEDWSAPTRVALVDLGEPFETTDTITFKLPDTIGEVKLPDSADFNAGPAGFYRTRAVANGDTVEFERHVKVEMYRFSAQQYAGLKAWFGDMAKQDERSLVLEMR